MPGCFAGNCTTQNASKSLPSDVETRSYWIKLCGRRESDVSVNSRVCYRHFPTGGSHPTIQYHGLPLPPEPKQRKPRLQPVDLTTIPSDNSCFAKRRVNGEVIWANKENENPRKRSASVIEEVSENEMM